MNWNGFILLDEKRNAFLFIPSFYSLITTGGTLHILARWDCSSKQDLGD